MTQLTTDQLLAQLDVLSHVTHPSRSTLLKRAELRQELRRRGVHQPADSAVRGHASSHVTRDGRAR